MLPLIQIGPLPLQAPGLFLILGMWLGLLLAERLAARFKSTANDIYNLTFFAFIAGILGARLSYAAQHWAAFAEAPLNLFSLNPGLLDPIGGSAAALLAMLIYANRKNLAVWLTLDALTPFLAVASIGFHLSNFASGKAFGAETSLPWSIHLWGLDRHPTQIYDTLLAILILGWLWLHTRRISDLAPGLAGGIFWGFLALNAAARLFTEAFRGDSVLLFNNLRAAQIIAWALLALSLFMRMYLEKNYAPER
ncbi:MAG: prolipoprotein diacylglyceryl transferase [Anaerolineae bacterium]|nr:prolipoprotein diacylglyceryl transferase [Anaerolineae bacterium]